MPNSLNNSLVLATGLRSRLLPEINGNENIFAAATLLLKVAKLTGRPIVFAELAQNICDETATLLRPLGGSTLIVDSFDATLAHSSSEHVPPGIAEVLLLGVETHIAISQTAFGLLRMGKSVLIAADAIGSRHELDNQIALTRLAQKGAGIVTAESAIFEWLGSQSAPGYTGIADLIGDYRVKTSVGRKSARHGYFGSNGATQDLAGKGPRIAVGELLRQARMAKTLTLKEMATRCDCSLSQLSKIENNKAFPSLPLLLRLSAVLDKDVKSFLGD